MSSIILTKEHGIGKIMLNRPRAYNSINEALGNEWIDALDDCINDQEVKVIIITGSGPAFCSGQDLKEAKDPKIIAKFHTLLDTRYNPIIRRIVNTEKPVIAAVNGMAVGAGANFALLCDIVLATESATFIQAFNGIGLIPDVGGTYFLPRLIGRARAMAYAMLGDEISARKAEEIGMIYRAIPDESFEEEVYKIAHTLANKATFALGLTKKAINLAFANTLEEQLDVEKEFQIKAILSDDFKEGIAAFLEKRKPIFKGK